MRVCELCGGMGVTGLMMCAPCQGTGVISLGYESADHHAGLVVAARLKAARLGWIEEVWEPVDTVANYPALARKVRRTVEPWLSLTETRKS